MANGTFSSFRTSAACLFMIVSTAFVYSFTLAQHNNNHNHGRAALPESVAAHASSILSRFASPATVQAVAQDVALQQNYLDAVDITADLTKRLADYFESIPEVRQASENVDAYRDMLLARNGNSSSLSDKPTIRQLFPPPPDMNGSLIAGFSRALGDVFSSIGDSLLKDVGGAALFLGSGLGAGTAQGLKLAPAAMTKMVAAKVASDNGQKATGLNPAIMNAAMGATAALIGAVNATGLTSGLSVQSLNNLVDLRGLALGFAEGLGNGTSAGLQLSPQAALLQAPPGNTSGEIAGTFAFGLTKTVASNINLSSLTNSLSTSALTSGLGNVNISQLTGGQSVSQIALSLAQGLGNGASSGLKLTQANLQPPAGNTVGDAAGAFGFGLVESVTTNINTTALLASATSSSAASAFNITQLAGNVSLAQTGQSFGSGLGSGLAAGLKLTQAIADAPDPNDDGVPSIAGNFAFGLTKGLVENINTTMLISSATAAAASSAAGAGGLGSLTSALDFSKVAQGGAMGFIQGAGDAINSLGGLQSLIDGTAMMPDGPLVTTPMTFNDSVGGAATGLGLGLGGQGTLTGVMLLSQLNVTSLLQQASSGQLLGGAAPAAQAQAPAPASVAAAVAVAAPVNGPAKRAVRRQAPQVGVIGTNNSFNLSVLINADTISGLGQRVLDTIGCDGIGGLALLGLGLYESGSLTVDTSGTGFNTTLIKQAVPKGLLRFNNGGNLYTIDGTVVVNNIDTSLLASAGGITVNGNSLIAFVAFLVIHILVALTVFVTLLPMVLSMEAVRNVLVRLGLKKVYASIPKWVNIIWLFLIGPTTVLALVFGALASGSSGHLRSSHGILGLLTCLGALGGVALHVAAKATAAKDVADGCVFPSQGSRFTSALGLRTIVNQITLMLTLPTVIAGFSDLAQVALCVTRVVPLEAGIALATGLTFLYTVASALSQLVIYLAVKDGQNAKKGKPALRLDVEASYGGKSSLKDTIQVIREEK